MDRAEFEAKQGAKSKTPSEKGQGKLVISLGNSKKSGPYGPLEPGCCPLFSLDFDVYIICVGPHFISQGDRPGVTSRAKREWDGRGGVEGKRLLVEMM